MLHAIDRLAALRVADVMAGDVLTVGRNQTIGEVARVLAQRDLSSAPVVDECGHCVGVITASDFVRRESKLQPAIADGMQLSSADDSQPLRCVPIGKEFVSHHMSTAVQSIDPTASLLKAARMMCDGHIHRLLVIDETNHPIGVISTMDIVAAMVNVVEEMNIKLGQHSS